MSDFQFSVSLPSPFEVSVLAYLTDILVSEGSNITEPEYLRMFLQIVDDGVKPKSGGVAPLVGKATFDEDVREEWLSVAQQCESIAQRIKSVFRAGAR